MNENVSRKFVKRKNSESEIGMQDLLLIVANGWDGISK